VTEEFANSYVPAPLHDLGDSVEVAQASIKARGNDAIHFVLRQRTKASLLCVVMQIIGGDKAIDDVFVLHAR
jgi:hypothetical protein